MVKCHRFTEVLCLNVECTGMLSANKYSRYLRAICTYDTKSFMLQGKVQVLRDSFFVICQAQLQDLGVQDKSSMVSALSKPRDWKHTMAGQKTQIKRPLDTYFPENILNISWVRDTPVEVHPLPSFIARRQNQTITASSKFLIFCEFQKTARQNSHFNIYLRRVQGNSNIPFFRI